MTLNPAPNPLSLAGRVALVTGRSAGLGKAMAMALGRAGAAVALNCQNNIGSQAVERGVPNN